MDFLTYDIRRIMSKMTEFYSPPERITVGKKSRAAWGSAYINGSYEGTETEDIDGWVDLQSLFDGGIEPEPHHVPGLLQRGKVHNLHSKPGEGKTILALWLATQVTGLGETVYYMDAENGPKPMVARLSDMGVTDYKRIKYNASPDLTTPVQIEKFLRGVDMCRPTLVVFDSLADMLAMNGLDENAAGDVTGWFGNVVKPLRDRGITVLILDHEPWESRGHARGSTAKFAKVDVELELKRTKHFDTRNIGEVTLKVKKDRFSGFEHKVRKLAVGGLEGELVVKPSDGIHFEGTLGAPSLSHTLEAIESFGERGATDSEWKAATKDLGTGRSAYYEAKAKLLEDERVSKRGDGSFIANTLVQTEVNGYRTSEVRGGDRTYPDHASEGAQNPHSNGLSGGPGGEPDLTGPHASEESGSVGGLRTPPTGPHAGSQCVKSFEYEEVF